MARAVVSDIYRWRSVKCHKPSLAYCVHFCNRDSHLTLVQLEPGPVATPFEHRPIGLELQLCQRYYFLAQKVYAVAGERAGVKASFPYSFPTSMREVPTIAGYGGGKAASYSDITKENLSMRLDDDYISQGFTADAEL